jgi:ankyrin repeat protein
MLLEAKADVNTRQPKKDGQTALQAAAEGRHIHIVERLLAVKADANAEPSYHRRTAL